MKALILRFDAPMMSFGGVIVDHHGFIERFPGTSMLTGLLANALGWDHGDFEHLQSLQARLSYAARWDVPPSQHLIDYQTVDLGQPNMKEAGWTTRGVPEHRKGGQGAKFGTHQRYRHYWSDGLMTLALGIQEGSPDLEALEAALRSPKRPLFLGRKTSLPARPLLDPKTPLLQGESLLAILKKVEVWDRHGNACNDGQKREACWPESSEPLPQGQMRRVYDLRDWTNQIPAGSRYRQEGLIVGEAP